MLTKLAFKNTGKSIKDFTVYFFTLAFGVCVFYMFNSIYAQQAMFDMTKKQTDSVNAVCNVLSYLSVFVAVVLGFLIVYANGFFIKRRKKELGIYMTLGMSKRKISLVLVLETSLIAVIALVIGLVGGIFLSQFMSVFTAMMFETDMTNFHFVFSFDAMIKSVMYFGVIFIVVMIFNVLSVSKFKLIDLIYGDRKNQRLKIRNVKVSTGLCVLSMGILGTAYYRIIHYGMFEVDIQFTITIIMGIVGTVLFFFSFSGLLTTLIRKNKRIYYNNLNMFIVRQFGSKINTNFISMSVVSIVLLLTIGIFASGYSIQSIYSKEMKSMGVYEYSYISEFSEGESISDFEDFVKSNEYVNDYVLCRKYTTNLFYSDFNVDLPQGYDHMDGVNLQLVSVSDYNKMAELIGNEKIELDNNSYALVSCMETINEYFQKVVDSDAELNLNGNILHPLKWVSGAIQNMDGGVIVVSDKTAEENSKNHIYCEILNLSLKDSSFAEKFEEQAAEYRSKYNESHSNALYSAISRSEIYNSNITVKAILSFIAIYLGIVFMVTCAAILAIQQLTETADNKHRYDLLEKLGADRKMLNRALFIQILCYFIFPLILAVIHSIFGLIAVQRTLMTFAKMDISSTVVPTSLFVGAIYTVYFFLTYISSKNIIKKKLN